MADSLVEGRDVSVETEHHAVTFTGSVPSEAAHDRAISIAANTKGVEGVTDHLSIVPTTPER